MKRHILGNIEPATFFREYWQKKPLLIRDALPDFPVSITPDELAGLSLDEDVRARIVLEKDGNSPWECRHGPFTTETFGQLPETHWTLLVQDIEKLLPEFAKLLDYFLFLPRWRIDDLMVSFAAPQGSVGPHIDQYDVFLLQGMGQRQWQIQQRHVSANDLLENTELQILRSFKTEEEWILGPGDLLYLPPGVAHYGVAVDDCLTYSIGFRAPSMVEFIQGLAETLSGDPDLNERYCDQFTHACRHPGELGHEALDHIYQFMMRACTDKSLVTRAVGSLLSEASLAMPDVAKDIGPDALKASIGKCCSITVHPATRMLYVRRHDGLEWYIDGAVHRTGHQCIEIIVELIDNYHLEGSLVRTMAEDPDLFLILHGIYENGGLDIDLTSDE